MCAAMQAVCMLGIDWSFVVQHWFQSADELGLLRKAQPLLAWLGFGGLREMVSLRAADDDTRPLW